LYVLSIAHFYSKLVFLNMDNRTVLKKYIIINKNKTFLGPYKFMGASIPHSPKIRKLLQ